MKIYKTETCNQYQLGDKTLCVTTATWRKIHQVTRECPTLFIGGAWGEITPKFAAAILKQFRRESPRQGGAK